ncbi:MAG: GlsB/YeaQ/YmgE family stress response membrane protein [Solirubrobacterales bacterium]|nr:GlsB/YeaQ/YmgE family stress response membrane protein [Solirubrobacterales bacterium]
MVGLIIYLLVIGVIAGYLARLLVPGPDKIGFVRTVALGIIGSFIGGFLGYLITGEDFGEGALQASGIFGSIIGAVIALLIYRAMTGGPTPHGGRTSTSRGPKRR